VDHFLGELTLENYFMNTFCEKKIAHPSGCKVGHKEREKERERQRKRDRERKRARESE